MRQLINRLKSRLAFVVRPVVVAASIVLVVGGIALLLLSQQRPAHLTALSQTPTSTLAQNAPSATTTITVQAFTPTVAATATVRPPTVTPIPTYRPTATPSPTPIPVTQEVFTCATATPEQSLYHQYYYAIHVCLHTSPAQPGEHVTNLISTCGMPSQSSTGVTLDASGAADYTYYDWLSCAPPTTYTLTAQTDGLSTAPCGECSGQRLPLSGSVSIDIP